jgi:hypothetical protein
MAFIFTKNGTSDIAANSTTIDGYVGIGTTEPGELLDVAGNVYIKNVLAVDTVEVTTLNLSSHMWAYDATIDALRVGSLDVTSGAFIDGNLSVAPSSSIKLRDTTGEFFKISTEPYANGSTITKIFSQNDWNDGNGIQLHEALRIRENGNVTSRQFSVNSELSNTSGISFKVGGQSVFDGKVGIGSAAPTTALDVAGKIKASNSGNPALNLPVFTSAPTTYVPGDVWILNSGSNYYLKVCVANNTVKSVTLS